MLAGTGSLIGAKSFRDIILVYCQLLQNAALGLSSSKETLIFKCTKQSTYSASASKLKLRKLRLHVNDGAVILTVKIVNLLQTIYVEKIIIPYKNFTVSCSIMRLAVTVAHIENCINL